MPLLLASAWGVRRVSQFLMLLRAWGIVREWLKFDVCMQTIQCWFFTAKTAIELNGSVSNDINRIFS